MSVRKTLYWRSCRPAVTPESAFVHLFGRAPDAFWLDSARSPGRWSFMGDASHPRAQRLAYRTAPRELTVTSSAGTRVHRHVDLFDELQRRTATDPPDDDPALPVPFKGGFVGVLGYGLRPLCGSETSHASGLPDAMLLYVERLVAFDGSTGTAYAIALCEPHDAADAAGWVDGMASRLRALPGAPPAPLPGRAAAPRFRLELDRGAYLAAVRDCQRHIAAGEAYELCLTNRLRAAVDVDPLALYRTLRRRNPAPQAAFLRLAQAAVLCSSPERFLQAGRDGLLRCSPIKGTAPRAEAPSLDHAAAESLRRSEKERAEHLMIVDLLRNDLGRVCRTGSVRVPRLMDIEAYATVHQMVSTIEGTLRPGATSVDAIRAAFPGGSMTGAPKLRAMAILDTLERSARGPYAGALGWLGLDGAADFAIVIRSIVVQPGSVSIGIGGAVVADSDPQAEFEETMLKGDVLMRAVAWQVGGEMAEANLEVDGAFA